MIIKTKYWELLLAIKNSYKTLNPKTEQLLITTDYRVEKSAVSQLPVNGLAIFFFRSPRRSRCQLQTQRIS